jgi:hypothetical protein
MEHFNRNRRGANNASLPTGRLGPDLHTPPGPQDLTGATEKPRPVPGSRADKPEGVRNDERDQRILPAAIARKRQDVQVREDATEKRPVPG